MKRWRLLGGGLLLAAAVLLGAVIFLNAAPKNSVEMKVRAAVLEQAESRKHQDAAQDTEAAGASEPEAYESPVDFDSLREMNPDIYAWLYIPETDINYPILQSGSGDDEFYLDHDSTGKSSRDGSIFTQGAYNAKDFSDPVTLVYGHHMRSGAMFGNLQEIYSAQDGLEEHREILVYLPDRELRYQVFAAVPHDMRHILYYNDFSDPDVFQVFLEQTLSVRSINARVDDETEVTAADQLLILSTCLRGDSKQRFLVLAKKAGDSSIP